MTETTSGQTPPPSMTEFMRRSVPLEPGGRYRKGATALKAACWYSLIWTSFWLTMLIVTAVGSLIGATFIGAFIDTFLPGDDPTGVLTSGAIGALIMVTLLAFASIIGTVGFMLMAWGNRVYLAWLDKDPSAPGSAQAIGITMIVVACLELVFTFLIGILDVFFFWPVLVIGILITVHAKNEKTLQAFRDHHSEAAAPSGQGTDS